MKSILFKVIKKEMQDKFEIKKFSFDNFVKEENLKKEKRKKEEKKEKDKEIFEVKKENNLETEEEKRKKVEEGYKEGYEKGYNEGYEKGYKEGFEKGLKDGDEKVKELIERYKETLEKLNSLREKVYEEAQSEMILIVKEALKKIVSAEIKSSEEFILNVIKETTKNIIDSKKIVIKVSSEDYKFLTSNREKLDSLLSGKEIEIVEDPGITRGGCLIQTDMGEVDSTVETKLEEVLNILEEK